MSLRPTPKDSSKTNASIPIQGTINQTSTSPRFSLVMDIPEVDVHTDAERVLPRDVSNGSLLDCKSLSKVG